MNEQKPNSLGVGQILMVSIISGMAVGALALCFTNSVADLFGVQHDYGFRSISFRCGAAAIISLAVLLPVIAVGKQRRDLLALVVASLPLGFFGCFMFLIGGHYRWGAPPQFMWPIFGGFMVYSFVLTLVTFKVQDRLSRKSKDGIS